MIETACDFVYNFDRVLSWRGLEQNKEVMLPHPIKGWTRSRIALIDPGSPHVDQWVVISTDLRSKSEGEGHEEALRFTEDEWGKKAAAAWQPGSKATCIFTTHYGEVKMMYTKNVEQLVPKRYAGAIRLVDHHLQFWIPQQWKSQ